MNKDIQCPCGAEWATIEIRTEFGSARVGKRCAGLLESLARLAGMEPRRQPAVQVVK